MEGGREQEKARERFWSCHQQEALTIRRMVLGSSQGPGYSEKRDRNSEKISKRIRIKI